MFSVSAYSKNFENVWTDVTTLAAYWKPCKTPEMKLCKSQKLYLRCLAGLRVFLYREMTYLNWSSRYFNYISSVIRQKDESQNRGNKNTKHAKFSEKRTFFTLWYACALFFCNLRFEIRPFPILPTICHGVKLIMNSMEKEGKKQIIPFSHANLWTQDYEPKKVWKLHQHLDCCQQFLDDVIKSVKLWNTALVKILLLTIVSFYANLCSFVYFFDCLLELQYLNQDVTFVKNK